VLALVELAERPEVDPAAAEALVLPDLVEVEQERLCRRPAVAPLGTREYGPRALESLPARPRDAVGEADEVVRLAPPLAEAEGRELGQAVVVAGVIGAALVGRRRRRRRTDSCPLRVRRAPTRTLLAESLKLLAKGT